MDFSAAKDFIIHKLRVNLPEHLYYHGLHHTLDVYQASEEIAEQEGISEEDMKLLRTAALFHDAGFMETYQDHEAVSCNIVREHLPQYGYTQEQIETICEMIMATKIPQTPHSHLGQILCDADLYYLGREDFFPVGETLFKEFKIQGIVQNERDWNELQIRFLESHHYFTQTAIQRRAKNKELHLNQVRKIVANYAV